MNHLALFYLHLLNLGAVLLGQFFFVLFCFVLQRLCKPIFVAACLAEPWRDGESAMLTHPPEISSQYT